MLRLRSNVYLLRTRSPLPSRSLDNLRLDTVPLRYACAQTRYSGETHLWIAPQGYGDPTRSPVEFRGTVRGDSRGTLARPAVGACILDPVEPRILKVASLRVLSFLLPAGKARDYGEKLAHEMERLQRLQQALYPDQRASLEVLRRLVSRLAELEAQEQAAREESFRREDQLRQEIADFKGSSATPTARLDSGKDAGKAARESTRGSRPVVGNPLTEGEQGDVADDTPGVERLQAQEDTTGATGTQDRVLEGNALLSEGLMRIEAAHRAAAAERDVVAIRLSRLRLAVARRQREEDATPGHAELLQYLSRFEELGLHARERDKRLRWCQAEKSMLALTRETLAEEARLLETVAGGVDEASKLKNVREAFLKQFDGMIEVSSM